MPKTAPCYERAPKARDGAADQRRPTTRSGKVPAQRRRPREKKLPARGRGRGCQRDRSDHRGARVPAAGAGIAMEAAPAPGTGDVGNSIVADMASHRKNARAWHCARLLRTRSQRLAHEMIRGVLGEQRVLPLDSLPCTTRSTTGRSNTPRRAHAALLARETHKHVVSALGAPDSREPLPQVAALQVVVHGLRDDRAPEGTAARSLATSITAEQLAELKALAAAVCRVHARQAASIAQDPGAGAGGRRSRQGRARIPPTRNKAQAATAQAHRHHRATETQSRRGIVLPRICLFSDGSRTRRPQREG